MKKVLTINSSEANQRLDIFLCSLYPKYSRALIQKVISDGFVLINGSTVKKNKRLNQADVVSIDETGFYKASPPILSAEKRELEILFEDEHFCAINKASGVVVHPGSGNRSGTLVNALLYHIRSLSDGSTPERPGIVHRLDKDTTGVLLVAKTNIAHYELSRLFAQREVKKIYLGFCIGALPKDSGIIDGPIGRSKYEPIKFCIRQDGRCAVTEYRLLYYRGGISLLRLMPRSGRTHQIRIHCSFAGFPIVHDLLYGGGRENILKLQPLERPMAYRIYKCFSRQALHAYSLSFIHPFTKKNFTVHAPLPDDFTKALCLLGDRKKSLLPLINSD